MRRVLAIVSPAPRVVVQSRGQGVSVRKPQGKLVILIRLIERTIVATS